jgi:long-chain acyl-CoA synthetase
LSTLCVSQKTIGLILDLKSKSKLPNLTHLIAFDQVDDKVLAFASSLGLELISWKFLVDDGYHIQNIIREEPTAETIMYLGVTSGTTGDPKIAMLTHKNFISG